MSNPLAQNVKPPYWRLSGDGSGLCHGSCGLVQRCNVCHKNVQTASRKWGIWSLVWKLWSEVAVNAMTQTWTSKFVYFWWIHDLQCSQCGWREKIPQYIFKNYCSKITRNTQSNYV